MNIAGFIIANHSGVYRKRRKAWAPQASTVHTHVGPPIAISNKAIAHVAESNGWDAQSSAAVLRATHQTKPSARQTFKLGSIAWWFRRVMLRLRGADDAVLYARHDARARLKAFEQEDDLRRHARLNSQKARAWDKHGPNAIKHSMSIGMVHDAWDCDTIESRASQNTRCRADDSCGHQPVQLMPPTPKQARWPSALWHSSK